jgi:hypothetical protein
VYGNVGGVYFLRRREKKEKERKEGEKKRE